MSTDMIERVAQAIARTVLTSRPGPAPTTDEFHRALARSAITAMRDPTEAMVDAGSAALEGCLMPDCGGQDAEWAYTAMIDAALTPSSSAIPNGKPSISDRDETAAPSR